MIESVPNFSEGRDPGTLRALEDALGSVPGARVLDVHADPDHNRSVITLVGDPDAVLEAAFRGVRLAAERIDLRGHRGEHPRMGAADVVPFVPLGDASLETCAALARRLGERIGRALGIPVYLYGRAATRPGRDTPSRIRRPQFDRLAALIGRDTDWDPDFGPARLHPSAGATAVGARRPLVAYNVYLETDDVALARRIARAVRTSSGELPAVQALGFLVDGRAQVSMNLLDVDVTPPAVAYDAVAREAAREGVDVSRSEFVGLVPERAVPPDATRRLKLAEPVETRILERRMW